MAERLTNQLSRESRLPVQGIAPVDYREIIGYETRLVYSDLFKLFERYPGLKFGLPKGELNSQILGLLGNFQDEEKTKILDRVVASRRGVDIIDRLIGREKKLGKTYWRDPKYCAAILGFDDILQTNLELKAEEVEANRWLIPLGQPLSPRTCDFMLGVPEGKVGEVNTVQDLRGLIEYGKVATSFDYLTTWLLNRSFGISLTAEQLVPCAGGVEPEALEDSGVLMITDNVNTGDTAQQYQIRLLQNLLTVPAFVVTTYGIAGWTGLNVKNLAPSKWRL